MKRDRLMTIPNSISLSRLLLALGFVVSRNERAWIALIAAAGLTDFLDGWIARRENSQSTTGALIDPFADRVFVLTAVSAYLVHGILGTGQYFLFLSRDLATAVGFLVAKVVPQLRPAEFSARYLGKLVTVLQLIALFTVLVLPATTDGLIALIGGLSAVSIVDYTLALWKQRSSNIPISEKK